MSDLKTFKKGIKLRPEASAPTGSEGALYYKDNDGVYYHNGSSWVKLSTVGGSSLTTHSVTAGDTTYTAGANSEDIILCQPSSALTLTLPAASSSASKIFRILKTNADNTVTINTTGSDEVNGKSSISLTELNDSVSVVSDGSAWRNINSEQITVFDTIVTSAASSTSLSNITYYTADYDFILTSATVGTLGLSSSTTANHPVGDLEIDVLKGANRGAATQSVFTIKPKITLTKEVSSITTKDFANTSDGHYFLLYSPDNNYVIWADKDGTVTNPTSGVAAATGATFLSTDVDLSGLSASSTSADVAIKFYNIINNMGEFSATTVNNTVTITCNKSGNTVDIFQPDGNTSHTPPGGSAQVLPAQTAVNAVSTSIQGSGAGNLDSSNAVLDGTHKIINKGDILKLSITSKPAGLASCYIKIKGVK